MAIRLDDVTFFDEELDATFRTWREAIEAARNWTVGGGGAEYDSSVAGHTLFVKAAAGGTVSAIVQTGGISASPSENQLGEGNVKLKLRTTGSTLIDGPIIKCYSRFKKAVPAGTWCEVSPDREASKMVGADCPLT
jgi:hypothetical protein